MSLCRRCGRAIVWAITDKNRRIPVDRDPVADGTLLLFTEEFATGDPVDDPTPVQRARTIGMGELVPARWRAHFASCPAYNRGRAV